MTQRLTFPSFSSEYLACSNISFPELTEVHPGWGFRQRRGRPSALVIAAHAQERRFQTSPWASWADARDRQSHLMVLWTTRW
jgi:hypothetical protein